MLTAPYFLIIFFGTFKILFFELLEYVTKPNLNTLDEPLIPVIDDDNKPQVQDSATDKVSFFFLNNFTKFSLIFFIVTDKFYQP